MWEKGFVCTCVSVLKSSRQLIVHRFTLKAINIQRWVLEKNQDDIQQCNSMLLISEIQLQMLTPVKLQLSSLWFLLNRKASLSSLVSVTGAVEWFSAPWSAETRRYALWWTSHSSCSNLAQTHSWSHKKQPNWHQTLIMLNSLLDSWVAECFIIFFQQFQMHVKFHSPACLLDDSTSSNKMMSSAWFIATMKRKLLTYKFGETDRKEGFCVTDHTTRLIKKVLWNIKQSNN